MSVATELIGRKTAEFDAGQFKDHYRQALRGVIDKKLKSRGKKIKPETEEPSAAQEKGNVIDLMSALKSSLETTGKKKATRTRKAS